MWHRGLLVAAAALALAGAGCGESAGDFRARADRVCADTRAAVDNLGEPRTLAGTGRIAARARGVARGGLSELRELGDPPSEIAAGWQALLTALEAQLPLLEQTAAAGRAGDAAKVERLAARGRSLEARAAAAAEQAGLRTCGTRPGAPGA